MSCVLRKKATTPVVDAAEPVAITASEAATLLVNGSGLSIQPATNQVLINLDTIAYTNPDTQTITTTVGGTPVTLNATPASYTWTWGDGTVTTTTDPGRPYPHQSVTHRYTTTATGITITLTTTWTATYTPQGQPTQPVTGTVATTQTSAPFDVLRTTSYNTDQAETVRHH